MKHLYAAMVVAGALAACGGDDGGGDGPSGDPRCVNACKGPQPTDPDRGRVCSGASQQDCVDECEARIAGTAPVCATCLVEDACNSVAGDDCDGSVSSPDFCDGGTCETKGPAGRCEYPQNDTAARDACRDQVDPRTTVQCRAVFEPVSDCASECD